MQNYPPTPDPQPAPAQAASQYAPGVPWESATSPLPSGTPMPQGPTAPGFPPTQAATTSPHSNRGQLLLGGGVGCGVLLVMCMCASMLGALASQGRHSVTAGSAPTTTQQQSHAGQPASPPRPVATAQPTETPRPRSTATPNPNADFSAYSALVMSDSSTLSTDLNQVGASCGAQDLSGCRSALVTVRADSASFLDDLNGLPMAPCMASVDKPLRAALHDVHSAAQEVIDGIDEYDVSKVQDGTSLMNRATTEINTASSAMDTVHCP